MRILYLQMSFSILFILLLNGCAESKKNVQKTQQEHTEAEKDYDLNLNSDKKTILFYGNSLTAGYGLKDKESFPSLIQAKIDSLGLSYQVINAGLSGETSSGGKERISWVLRNEVDIFVLELGANDMLRGLDLKATEANLAYILEEVREKYPSAQLVVAGMQAPPNMGQSYTEDFASIFPRLAKQYDARLIPFLLDGVAGIDSLNLADDKHPNAEGQKIVAQNVWRVLYPMLR